MKKFLFLLAVIPTFAFSADLVSTKPNVLELKKYRTMSGKLELRYIHDNPRIVMRVGPGAKETDDFLQKVMDSDLTALNCDGDFFPSFDRFGMSYMHINSLKSCLDEEGSVVAHSINMKALSDKDVAASKKFIEDSMKPVVAVAPANVNDSNKPKEDANSKAGVFSPKLEKKTIAK